MTSRESVIDWMVAVHGVSRELAASYVEEMSDSEIERRLKMYRLRSAINDATLKLIVRHNTGFPKNLKWLALILFCISMAHGQTNIGPITITALSFPYPNSSNGTTCNGLAKIDTTPGSPTLGKAVDTAANDELPILGVVIKGCGTSGKSTIAILGPVQVIFDSASVTVGDTVGISNSLPAAAFDFGTSGLPTSASVVVGTVILSPQGALPSACTVAPGCWIFLNAAGAGGGGGGGSANALVNNPGGSSVNTIAPTATTVVAITPGCPTGAASSLDCVLVKTSGGVQAFAVQNSGLVVLGASGSTPNIGSGTTSNTDWGGILPASGSTVSYTFTGSYTNHALCTAVDLNSGTYLAPTYTGTTSVSFGTTSSGHLVQYHCPYTK